MFVEELKEFYDSNRPDGVYSIAPMMLWTSFNKLRAEYGLFEEGTKKNQWELLEDHLISTKIYTEEESMEAAVSLRDMLKKAGVPVERLLLPVLIGLAYQEEAKIMIDYGIDPEVHSPFSVTIDLNYDHPLVKQVLEEEKKKEEDFWRQQLSYLENEPKEGRGT